jgi:hypothetical protein
VAAGNVFTDQQVITKFVEAVGVPSVGGARNCESWLGGEHIVTKALGCLDQRGVGG